MVCVEGAVVCGGVLWCVSGGGAVCGGCCGVVCGGVLWCVEGAMVWATVVCGGCCSMCGVHM